MPMPDELSEAEFRSLYRQLRGTAPGAARAGAPWT